MVWTKGWGKFAGCLDVHAKQMNIIRSQSLGTEIKKLWAFFFVRAVPAETEFPEGLHTRQLLVCTKPGVDKPASQGMSNKKTDRFFVGQREVGWSQTYVCQLMYYK